SHRGEHGMCIQVVDTLLTKFKKRGCVLSIDRVRTEPVQDEHQIEAGFARKGFRRSGHSCSQRRDYEAAYELSENSSQCHSADSESPSYINLEPPRASSCDRLARSP